MSAITELYDRLGKMETASLLGVHHNVAYKWYIFEDGRSGGRDPNKAAVRLADVIVYLQSELGWKDEDIRTMMDYIANKDDSAAELTPPPPV